MFRATPDLRRQGHFRHIFGRHSRRRRSVGVDGRRRRQRRRFRLRRRTPGPDSLHSKALQRHNLRGKIVFDCDLADIFPIGACVFDKPVKFLRCLILIRSKTASTRHESTPFNGVTADVV